MSSSQWRAEERGIHQAYMTEMGFELKKLHLKDNYMDIQIKE